MNFSKRHVILYALSLATISAALNAFIVLKAQENIIEGLVLRGRLEYTVTARTNTEVFSHEFAPGEREERALNVEHRTIHFVINGTTYEFEIATNVIGTPLVNNVKFNGTNWVPAPVRAVVTPPLPSPLIGPKPPLPRFAIPTMPPPLPNALDLEIDQTKAKLKQLEMDRKRAKMWDKHRQFPTP